MPLPRSLAIPGQREYRNAVPNETLPAPVPRKAQDLERLVCRDRRSAIDDVLRPVHEVQRTTPEPKVIGSSPIGRTKAKNNLQQPPRQPTGQWFHLGPPPRNRPSGRVTRVPLRKAVHACKRLRRGSLVHEAPRLLVHDQTGRPPRDVHAQAAQVRQPRR